jgi:hypothetical protein
MGVDPVFLGSSSLFDDRIPISSYFNLSDGSGDINANGYPWGFHSYSLKGEFVANDGGAFKNHSPIVLF